MPDSQSVNIVRDKSQTIQQGPLNIHTVKTLL